MKSKQVLLVEPFFGGSHRRWAEELQRNSKHNIEFLTLPDRHWKWRMHGGAISLAEQFHKMQTSFDLIITTDFLDVSLFQSLIRHKYNGRFVHYFHENQLTYPWSSDDPDVWLKRDMHYAFINYSSALAANEVWFNSMYHKNSFTSSLPQFLSSFPDFQNTSTVHAIEDKSKVLPLGFHFNGYPKRKNNSIEEPLIFVWNHRWEYDKNPELFFASLDQLKTENILFKLIVLGTSSRNKPNVFKNVQENFKHELLHFGAVPSHQDYLKSLSNGNTLLVTSNQDFFGYSVVEGMYCGNYPILPNRLAYPEHIPAALHDQYLYNDEKDIIKCIKRRMNTNFEPEIVQKHLFEKYDWQNLITLYDSAIEQNT